MCAMKHYRDGRTKVGRNSWVSPENFVTKSHSRNEIFVKSHKHINAFRFIPGLCLHTASYNQLLPTVQGSIYVQLHITNSCPEFRAVSTHSFMLPTISHSSDLCLQRASYNQLSGTVQVSVYTQLHTTNSQPQLRSLSTHSFM